MRARSLKILISLLFLIGIAFYLWVFHSPERVLNENQNRFQDRIHDFKTSLEKARYIPEFQVLIRQSRAPQAIQLDPKILESYLSRNYLDLEIFQNKELRFWSTNIDDMGNWLNFPWGLSLQKFKTGWFLVQKTQTQGLTEIFRTPVRHEFEFPNPYLKNEFLGNFDLPEFFLIQKGIKPQSRSFSRTLLNPDTGAVLGYLILDKLQYLRSLDADQVGAFIFSVMVFLFILQITCTYFHEKNFSFLSILFGIIMPGSVFYVLSQYFLRHKLISVSILDSRLFFNPPLFNSLGDYALWIAFFLWLIYFFRNLSPRFKIFREKEWGSILRFIGFLLMGGVAFVFSYFFKTLINYANIPLDLTDIFNLNPLTFLVFGFLALTYLAFYYSQLGLIRFIRNQPKGNNSLAGILTIFFYLAATYLFWGLSGIYLGFAIISLWVIIYVFGRNRPIYRLAFYLFGISLISSIQIAELTHSLEKSNRISMAKLLSNSRDSVAEKRLTDIGGQIQADFRSLDPLLKTSGRSLKTLSQEIQKRYFDRNFPNFDIQYYFYDSEHNLMVGSDNISLESFQSLTEYPGTLKVSPFFYQVLGKIGLNNYFGIIPIPGKGNSVTKPTSSLVIRLNARFIRENNAFQELLLDQKEVNNHNKEAYSYAFYKDGSLIDKYGKYPYSIGPQEFLPLVFTDKMQFKTLGDFDHLIFQPQKGEYIIVSTPSISLYKQGTLFSYILGFNLLFIGGISLSLYIFSQIKEIKGLRRFFRSFSSLRLLYKTRIQVSIVASVFLSLIVIGWITLAYVNNQYKLQQRDLLSNEINNLRIVFEREMPTDSLYRFSEKNNRLFLDFSGGHSQDLNFYNTDGDLLYTSLPKIFERGLLSQKMSSNAYYEMFISGRTEFIQDELIGKLKFLSGYTPVRNNLNNQVMGYLNLPYFANQIELKQRLSGFSNSLINVYIICFLLIGLFAIALANSLTNPLSLVEKSLGTTQIDDINKPIPWKRDDEIGDLISGYNKMIQTLEDSAKKLAKSERESAWREMAKQVAHEIKNPLTPLKLGIQHLERSWKEKDPHFEEKFIRFTKTFIEQIDSLSAISTEFSNFAQMPIAHEEKINVVEILDMVIQLFRSTENLKIELLYDIQKAYLIFADKDQISRAFTNLIKNAVQSIPESRPGMIRVGIEDLNEKIRISIEDNGIGIPREFYPKIFQPNFTTKGSGTGLGLAFVKNVVVQAGGAVDFNSTEGIGTQFIIEFPILRDR